MSKPLHTMPLSQLYYLWSELGEAKERLLEIHTDDLEYDEDEGRESGPMDLAAIALDTAAGKIDETMANLQDAATGMELGKWDDLVKTLAEGQ